MTRLLSSQQVEEVEVTIEQESYSPPLTSSSLLQIKFKGIACYINGGGFYIVYMVRYKGGLSNLKHH